MRRVFTGRGVWWGLLALAVAGSCSHAPLLDGRIHALRDVVERAEKNGAYSCAPRELAAARSHLDFADVELAQGDQRRVEEHLALAEPNARAALSLSPPERCLVVNKPKPGDADGDGILDKDDACPQEPEDFDGQEDEDGCPEDQDTDGDGLMDQVDLCVAEAEDVDGYLDTDGCPELDNDGDGVPDAKDGCPLAAEDPDGFQDEDGCADEDNDADATADVEDECPNEPGPPAEKGCPKVYKNVEVTSTHIRITQKVYFKTAKAKIQARSFDLLNTVAQVMTDYPEIVVQVQGHTDSRGSDRYNMRLSEARAQSVRTYLLERGVDTVRMTAHGYGESKPIDSNKTKSGRAANRRVEFVRTDDAAVKASQAGETAKEGG